MPEFVHQGRRIHFLDEGKGRAVLLLHAFPLTSEMYRPQLAELSRHVRVLAPDLRGFGGSEPGEGPTQMTDFAEDALALLDHLGIDSAVVGGVSMGGYVAMAVLQLDPGRVEGLLLMDTHMGADDEAGKARREENARAVEERGMVVFEELLMPKMFAPPAPSELEDALRKMMRSCLPSSAASATRGMALRPDSRNILARFAGPALILVGEMDAITTPQRAEEMAGVLPSSRLVVIPGAAHLASFERPAEVNRAILGFLGT